MEKIIETHIYDFSNSKDIVEFKEKYNSEYSTGIVYIGESGNHYLGLSTDIIVPFKKVTF